ncbi:uncharacterized protein LOC132744436 [Ruditapes philippinarum]|uniref:uncharacterized protein LOC132744436 n=1 Tax=Ruditapes philippinarum TaxID=129788 RepID=UPI00295BE64F|nr:uncharacterized protein LOC132744436 [Ruditapes philippinarum]
MGRLLNSLIFVGMIVVGRCDDPHCCVSSQFSSRIRIETASAAVGREPRIDYNDFFMDYDRDMKIEKISGTLTKDVGGSTESTVNYTVINDYQHGKSYNFGNFFGYAYCNVSQINVNDMNPGCVPKSFNLTGTFRLGSGSDSAKINVFEGMEGNVQRTVVTTANECNPISMASHGALDDGSYIKENMFYINFVQNSTFPAGTFTIPDNCKTAG